MVVPLLPGSLLVLGAILVWASPSAAPPPGRCSPSPRSCIALGAVVKYVVPGRRLKEVGIPGSTLVLGAVLGVVGFFVIPVVGLLVGFVLGVYLAELSRVGGPAAWPATVACPEGRRPVDADRVHRRLLAAAVWVAGVVVT